MFKIKTVNPVSGETEYSDPMTPDGARMLVKTLHTLGVVAETVPA